MSAAVDQSRRNWLRRVMLLKPEEVAVEDTTVVAEEVPKKAIIQGRYCLAYQRSFCSTCSERCPVDGAIKVEIGIPQIVADVCTGCGICAEVCPAPTNAILMLPVGGQKRHV